MILDDIRAACAAVEARARFVHIDDEHVARLASAIDIVPGEESPYPFALASADAVAFVITHDAINFGSGWHPHVVKLPGQSGAVTMVTRLHEHVRAQGVLTPDSLAAMTTDQVATILVQPLEPPVDELMALYAEAWRDLGRLLLAQYGGRFEALVEAAGHSAARLADLLLAMPLYRDIHPYDGLDVPLLKRAQITAADLHLALEGRGLGRFDDLERLTMFPDNLVPHVLRIEGVLRFAPDLVARIDAEELLDVGSPEEVEIRAVAVEACERIVAARAAAGRPTTAMALDQSLWSRGQDPRYKAHPRHRTRCPYY